VRCCVLPSPMAKRACTLPRSVGSHTVAGHPVRRAQLEALPAPPRRAVFDNTHAELAAVGAAWRAGALSNFDYLMHLNSLASRTYDDLSQYRLRLTGVAIIGAR
jgi:hypothetical protein